MNRGLLKFRYNEQSGSILVECELVEGTVWMTKREIARLFNVYVSAVSNNLAPLFNRGELNESQVAKSVGDVMLYNLDVVIALSFRMRGGYCRHFREWITRQVKRSFSQVKTTPIYINIGDQKFVNN